MAGTAYSYTYTATGDPAPTFAVSKGRLPAGLTLNATSGVLSGTPKSAGRITFSVMADNGVGTPAISPTTPITVGSTDLKPGFESGGLADGTDTVTVTDFVTYTDGDTIVAFVSADGPSDANQRATVTGAGLTWYRVKCTCGHNGDAEIWTARAAGRLTGAPITSTLALTGFTEQLDIYGVVQSAGVGSRASMTSATGSARATLTTSAPNSLVVGVGTDPDAAITPTPGPGQDLIVNEYVGENTYWTQAASTAIPATGTSVTINDPQPAGHRWSLAVVEIL